ncbi:MAG TPA: methyltransferase domain-containing protein [Thermoanaerobaculia bacterium]|nr:methyltransferase domain-containing protein [Thermoanaerobaculia bacterium]
MSEREQLRRSWEENASAWSEAVRHDAIESRKLVTDEAIVRAVLELHPQTLLDLGCGEGWLARTLTVEGISVVGVDASAALIAAARELGGGRFLQLSYEALGSTAEIDERFDVIVANFSLLADNIHDVLVTVRQFLKPEGALVVQTVHSAFNAGTEPYADGWRVETFAAFPGSWPEKMPWYFRTLASWQRELHAAGFVITEIREPLHPRSHIPASILFLCRDSRPSQ